MISAFVTVVLIIPGIVKEPSALFSLAVYVVVPLTPTDNEISPPRFCISDV